MRKPCPHLKKQKGLVLLLAMMIVVLVTSLVVATSWRFELGMSRNENRWHGLQGRLILDGGEKLVAKLLLMEDFNDPTIDGSEDVDNRQEIWMSPFSEGVDGGTITVQMEDAQARFNINLLSLTLADIQQASGSSSSSDDEPEQVETPKCKNDPSLFDCKYTVAQRRFIRYLQTLPMNEQPITPAQASEIVDALIDWMDTDSNTNGFGGAEQSYYNGLEVPIVVSNAPMTTISELSLVKGVTPEIYERLLPNVIALPTTAQNIVPININTMPDAMLRMFNAKDEILPLDEEQAADLTRLRNEVSDPNIPPGQGYQQVQDFIDDIITDLAIVPNAADIDTSQLSVGTSYFIYNGEVIIGDKTRRVKTLMRRDRNQGVEVLWRTDANF